MLTIHILYPIILYAHQQRNGNITNMGNLILAIASTPPGYNLAELNEIGTKVENTTRHMWSNPGEKVDPKGPVRIERFWFIARSTSTFIGAFPAI